MCDCYHRALHPTFADSIPADSAGKTVGRRILPRNWDAVLSTVGYVSRRIARWALIGLLPKMLAMTSWKLGTPPACPGGLPFAGYTGALEVAHADRKWPNSPEFGRPEVERCLPQCPEFWRIQLRATSKTGAVPLRFLPRSPAVASPPRGNGERIGGGMVRVVAQNGNIPRTSRGHSPASPSRSVRRPRIQAPGPHALPHSGTTVTGWFAAALGIRHKNRKGPAPELRN